MKLAEFQIGDVVECKDYPAQYGRVSKVEPLIETRGALRSGRVRYTVKWSDHPSGTSQHLNGTLNAVIKKLSRG